MSKRIIGYIRVSTDKQERSGLGLEAQLSALEAYASMTGCEIIRVYREVESGKRNDRPELAKAMAHAKRSKATLVIAKLDRLARNVHFVSGLMESGVDFVCCDNPHANRLTIHVLAATAEDEARRISERTKAALAAYKRRGGKLGAARDNAHTLTQDDRRRGGFHAGEVARTEAMKAYADLIPLMVDWRGEGESQQAIAIKLNEEGHTTRNGKPWNQVQVSRVLRRYTHAT